MPTDDLTLSTGETVCFVLLRIPPNRQTMSKEATSPLVDGWFLSTAWSPTRKH